MIGRATLDGVLDVLRGKTRARAREILLLLNRLQVPDAVQPLAIDASAEATSAIPVRE